MAPFEAPEVEATVTEEEVDGAAVGNDDVTPEEAMSQVKALLEVLEPHESIEVADAFGGVHTLGALLPARRQVRVMRELEALANRSFDRDDMPDFGAGAEGMIGAIVILAADEDILDSLSRAFALAHPEVMTRAAEAAAAAGVPAERCEHAADLFPVEEIVSGLVPFFLRLAKRLLSAMGPMAALVGAAEA